MRRPDGFQIVLLLAVTFLTVRCVVEDIEREQKCVRTCEGTKYACEHDGQSTPGQCDTAYQLCKLNCRPRGK